MKRIEDLKQEIINKQIGKFYIFYGNDYGIRHHYIKKICSYFSSKPKYIDNYLGVKTIGKMSSLFDDDNKLVIIYNDELFKELNQKDMLEFINGLNKYTCIFIYENINENSNIFKYCEEYITNFPIVKTKIAKEFIDDEIKLENKDKELLAYNCGNNYSTILLESDKIKSYADSMSMSDQVAYDTLKLKNQLIEIVDKYNVNEFMLDVLQNKISEYKYWYYVMMNNIDLVYGGLLFMVNDLIIAYMIKSYGRYNGGKFAYEANYSWSRILQIRDLVIRDDMDFLDCANLLARLDADVRIGNIQKESIVDYIFTKIL